MHVGACVGDSLLKSNACRHVLAWPFPFLLANVRSKWFKNPPKTFCNRCRPQINDDYKLEWIEKKTHKQFVFRYDRRVHYFASDYIKCVHVCPSTAYYRKYVFIEQMGFLSGNFHNFMIWMWAWASQDSKGERLSPFGVPTCFNNWKSILILYHSMVLLLHIGAKRGAHDWKWTVLGVSQCVDPFSKLLNTISFQSAMTISHCTF